MMKWAQIFLAIIMVILVVMRIGVTMADEKDHGEFYPRLTIVIDKKWDNLANMWLILCQDKNGDVWAFYDNRGEWEKGDIANLLMWDTGKHKEDHEIIEVYWEGYVEDINTFLSLEGWR